MDALQNGDVEIIVRELHAGGCCLSEPGRRWSNDEWTDDEAGRRTRDGTDAGGASGYDQPLATHHARQARQLLRATHCNFMAQRG